MRSERDSLGELPVPDDAYYGIQTVRCARNHAVTDHTFCELPRVIRTLAEIKKVCAMTNAEIGALEPQKAEAIAAACDEVIASRFIDQFPINVWRSHGTGANMNANEVIANRANEILTGHNLCIAGITVNIEHCRRQAELSLGLAKAASVFLGHASGKRLYEVALAEGISIRDAARSELSLSEAELSELFNVDVLSDETRLAELFKRFGADLALTICGCPSSRPQAPAGEQS